MLILERLLKHYFKYEEATSRSRGYATISAIGILQFFLCPIESLINGKKVIELESIR